MRRLCNARGSATPNAFVYVTYDFGCTYDAWKYDARCALNDIMFLFSAGVVVCSMKEAQVGRAYVLAWLVLFSWHLPSLFHPRPHHRRHGWLLALHKPPWKGIPTVRRPTYCRDGFGAMLSSYGFNRSLGAAVFSVWLFATLRLGLSLLIKLITFIRGFS